MIENLKYCYERRDLLLQMVLSKLKLGNRQFILGYLWWVLDPLLLMLIYWLLLGVIFHVGGAQYPLFVLCGLVPFRAITISFGQSVMSVSGRFSLINQIRFPRVFLPISDVVANHMKVFVGFLVVILVGLFYGIGFYPGHFLVLVPLAFQVLLVSGLSMINAVVGVFFSDYKNFIQFVTRVLMYLSPILYSIERIPERFRDIYLLNPVASLIVLYRDILMYKKGLDIHLLAVCGVEAVALFTAGFIVFSINERKLLKHI